MIAIIGGGAAGLGAAIACGERAIVWERNKIAGKKLLLSGAGQCNFTNANNREDFLAALTEFRNWLKPAFYSFDNMSFIKLLEEFGCPVYIREDRKVFPQSLKASDVRDTLYNIARQRGAKFMWDSKIEYIEEKEGLFYLNTNSGAKIRAQKVIIAAGGAAWSVTGSDGSSYRLASALGHKIHDPKPALARIEIEDYAPFICCAGLSLKAGLQLAKRSIWGELLFTHNGLSGPLILDNSRKLHAGEIIQIIICDCHDFLNLIQKHPKRKVSKLLQEYRLPQRLTETIMKNMQISSDLIAAELSASKRKQLLATLKNHPFKIKAIEDLCSSMSDWGGVDLKEVDSKTMQSRILKNVFFAGESLAYSLPSGGYSIQMAVSTGYLAGINAVNSI
ncbi:MAG: aminoacetone oxidase family FAD-binding enzyme [Candidatus Cloacimonetes bacterium]|nr:aminoacetone oxidase family FAD-binding enzyme [Candidatus Cloacimonadota bacterium]